MLAIIDHIKNSTRAKIQLLLVFLLFAVVLYICHTPESEKVQQSIKVHQPAENMSKLVGAAKPLEDEKEKEQVAVYVNDTLPQLNSVSGVKFESLEVIEVYRQVVAGINYFVKAKGKTAAGEEQIVHLRIYRDLKNNIELAAHQLNKKPEDKLEYFQ